MAIWHGLSGLTWIWLHPTTTLHLPRPSGSLGVLGGAWGSLWPCLWQSRGKNIKKCTSDKRVEIVKKYIWAALEAQNHHNQWPK